MAKKTSMQGKAKEELSKLLGEKREELRKLRFEAAGARVKDKNSLTKVRRDIARIMTELGTKKA